MHDHVWGNQSISDELTHPITNNTPFMNVSWITHSSTPLIVFSRLHGASLALALFVHYLTVPLCSPFVNSEAIEVRL